VRHDLHLRQRHFALLQLLHIRGAVGVGVGNDDFYRSRGVPVMWYRRHHTRRIRFGARARRPVVASQVHDSAIAAAKHDTEAEADG
jgi:hypothetical protein